MKKVKMITYRGQRIEDTPDARADVDRTNRIMEKVNRREKGQR